VESRDKATDIWQMPGPDSSGRAATVFTSPLRSFLIDLAADMREKTETQLSLIVGKRGQVVPWEVISSADPLTGRGPEELARLFNERRQLVVVGTAGSGKTIMAMQLKVLLAPRAPGDPVPVRFPLASWNPHVTSLRTWMARFLRELSPDATAAMSDEGLVTAIKRGSILPLFDGFDEISERSQPDAHAAIQLAVGALPAVLTSRPLTSLRDGTMYPDLPNATVVRLRPVTREDTAEYLRAVIRRPGESWTALVGALTLASDSPLAMALSTPLMVGMVRGVYSAPTRESGDVSQLLDTATFPDQASIERHLLLQAVPTTFARAQVAPDGEPVDRTAPRDAERWLMFLAAGVRTHGQIAFWSVARLAPKHLPALVAALTGGVLISLLAGPHPLLALGIESCLILGTCFGAGFGWAYAEGRRREYEEGTRTGYGGRARGKDPDLHTFVWRFVINLSMTLLSVAVAVGLGSLLWRSGSKFAGLDLSGGALGRFVLLLSVAAIGTILIGYAGGGLTAMILRSLPKIDMTRTGARARTPAEAVRKDRSATLVIGVLAWLVHGVIMAALLLIAFGTGGILPGLLSGAAAAVTAGTIFTFWGRYRVAHAWLALRGHLPWRLMDFLREAYLLGVLRQNGNFYEFRHARLQECLAQAYHARRR
jgi:hypothetical protein